MLPEPEYQPHLPCILVVEDEVLVRTLVAEELRTVGFSVIEAGRADEAWSYLEAGGSVDLVFSDVQMPGSFNGLELAHRVGAAYPTLPVILTSGNFGSQRAEESIRRIPKPYDIAQTITVMRATLGLRQLNAVQ